MELSRSKRIILGITLIAIVVLSFFAGYMLKGVKPSKALNKDARDEIIDILDKYYYKDFDKENIEYSSLKALVKALNDPYTYLYTTDTKTNTGYFGYGFSSSNNDLGIRVVSVYKDSPADLKGIKENDVVIGVDTLTCAKNGVDEVSEYLKNASSEVTLHMLRDYKKYDVKLTKANISINNIESKKIGDIGYIKLNEFSQGVSIKFKSALTELEDSSITGLVIDLRNNPGGLATEVASILRLFIDNNEAFLYLESSKDGKTDVYRGVSAEKKSYDIKILVNNNSASASEVFALAMSKIMHYELIGEHTFGKNVFQSDFELKNLENSYLHVTLGYWYGNKMEKIENTGINADVEVIDEHYIPMPINDKVYELDMADDEIKNIELMLKEMGYNTRVDGYFDSELEFILTSNFESDKLYVETKNKIYDAYKYYIETNDKVLNKAIELLS